MTRQQLLQIEQELEQSYFERTEEIRSTLTALLSRHHCLLLGPPGTAKSQLIRDLCERIGGSYFQWLLTKFTTPEELFGPISLKALEQDQYRRVTAGKLPEAHIAFIDEIWKASSSILNTLLTIINEREFHNDSQPQRVPLVSLFAASNELPESGELSALYDRFLIRHVSSYIADPQAFINMLALQTPTQKTRITLDELQAAQGEVEHIKVPDDVLIALTNLREILRKENIIASDRRYRQALSLIKASAYLGGRQQAAIEDLTILQHVLWSQPSEQKVVQKIVLNTINPTLSRIQELLDLAVEVYHQALDPNILKDPAKASEKGIEANVKLKKISEELARLQTTPATAQTLIEAQAKVNAYTAEILEKLLGLSPTPAPKKHA